VRCDLSITGDFRFFQEVTNMNMPESARVSMATSLLVSYVQGASRIFQNTNFDDDGSTTDNIHFGIRNLTVETRDAPRFRSEFIGVEAFLDLHSEADTSSFCLSYRITSRDFNNGVLGLAYVAKSNTAGGVCEPSLNTGIVTIINYNQRVPTVVTVLTLAHEAGHNFGSEHDPDDTAASVCSPGGNDGNFIMYPFANSGTRRNNNDFSSCSRAMMDVFIATRGQQDSEDCFSAADDLCENGLLDDGEDCDCGIQYDATTKVCDDDPCCNGTTCLLVNSTDSVNRTECSPDQGVCCSEACLYLNTSVPCAPETECAQATNCNGNSPRCPEPEAQIPTGGLDYILCNNGTATCVDNVCNGSFCVVLNADSCVCNKTDEICDVCCMVGGECVSTITLAAENGSMADLLPGGMGQRFPVGTPCNNFNGYCDTLHNCFQVDSEGALDRISSLFSSTNINVVIDFVTEKWWAVLIAVVGMLAGFFVLVLIIHLLLPRPEHVKHRSQRRQTIRRQRMQSRSHGGGHGHEMKMQY
jgi:disintegrin and metalloproteinase domain-containing protein 10